MSSIIDVEKELIGCMIIKPSIIPEVCDSISASDFENIGNSKMFKCVMNEFYSQKTIDISKSVIDPILLTRRMSSELSISVAESKSLLLAYDKSVASTQIYASLVAIIQKSSKFRKLKAAISIANINLTEESQEEIVSGLVKSLTEISVSNSRTGLIKTSDKLVDFYNGLFKPRKDELFKLGYSDVDRRLGGCERSDVTIIAARPGIGKSTFALNIALNQLKESRKVAFYSLEMSEQQVIGKILSAYGRIPYSNIKDHNVSEYAQQIAETFAKLETLSENLFICDESVKTIPQIRLECLNRQIDVLIIDYLQLLTPSDTRVSRNEQVSEMSRQLKIIAKDLNCWVICLSQLSRAVEQRQSSRPVLSDLRDSGGIEQDANEIIFLSKENADDENSDVVCEVAKNRFGACGCSLLSYNRPLNLLMSTDRQYQSYGKIKKGKSNTLEDD